MNHFQRLIIENFQSHQHTVIDLSPGLNVLVGPSDSGKSAILRALRWVLFNLPRGTDFIRSGEKECRVSIIFQDGSEVVRVRGSSSNRYLLRTVDGEEHIFEGFGNEVPEEIVEIHGIRTLKLDNKEIMIHLGTQLESPFLLFETAGNRAKTIGRVSGAHLIDNALKKASSDRQATNLDIKRMEQESEELRVKLLPYADLPELELQLFHAEKAFLIAKTSQNKRERLVSLQNMLFSLRQERGVLEKWLSYKDGIVHTDVLVRAIEQQVKRLGAMVAMDLKWKYIQQGLTLCRQQVSEGQTLAGLEECIRNLQFKGQRLEYLQRVDAHWKKTKREQAHMKDVVRDREGVLVLDPLMRILDQKVERMKGMLQLQSRAQGVQNEKKYVAEIFSKVDGIRSVDGILLKIVQQYERLDRCIAMKVRSDDLIWRIARGKQFQREREQEIAHLTQQWIETLRNVKQCPTCGSDMDASTLEHIMCEYQGVN